MKDAVGEALGAASWVWEDEAGTPDSFVRFRQDFEVRNGAVRIALSCDSNYELFVNGERAAFGQYADYPHDKVYDTVELSRFCRKGTNRLLILVWYYGRGFSTYWKGLPGLIFAVTDGDRPVAVSGKGTFCRRATDYLSGREQVITKQLGFSYTYDAAGYEDSDAPGYVPAHRVHGRPGKLRPRPIEKLTVLPFAPAVPLRAGKHRIYDLGRETVGYLRLRFRAPKGSPVRISYGEHLVRDADGQPTVPRLIWNRDFSVAVCGSGDWFDFSGFLRRLGCRYLEVSCGEDCDIAEIGLYPVEYPLSLKPFDAGNPLRRRIYAVSLHTLRCCMFEHYEDCPWREQSLYSLDSRHQMLCTYYATEETAFPRASLELFGNDRSADGLLHITSPAEEPALAIPSFSLYWILAMKEYADYTADRSLILRYREKMRALLKVFLCRLEDGLIPNFYGDSHYWNFYEWNPTLQGTICEPQEKSFDLILNALLSRMLQCMADMEERDGYDREAADCRKQAEMLNLAINRRFHRNAQGAYPDTPGSEQASELGQALAVLCGAATGETAGHLCGLLARGEGMIPATLSMKAFVFDALLETDREKYAGTVLKMIDRDYSYMLEQGATSFWEVLDGASGFDGGASLCHGWSAIPIVYYRRLAEYL